MSLGLVACGKATNNGSLDSIGAGGSAASALAGGGSAGVDTGASAAGAGVSGMPIAGNVGGVGGATSTGGSAGLLAGSAGNGGGTGGLTALGPDPQPALPPVATVTTSDSYLVFRQGGTLMLLDLKGTGQPVQINAAGSKLFQPAASRDGRFVYHVQSDPFPFNPSQKQAAADNVQLVALTDAGYVPGAPVAGFDGFPYLRYVEGFDASSRFAFLGRTLTTVGLDIVDGANNRVHGSLSGPFTGGSLRWAPKGYLFAYRVDSSGASGTTSQGFFAKIIEGGISNPQSLPIDSTVSGFSPDGKRLFYVTGRNVSTALGYIDPPAAPQQIYASTSPNGFRGVNIEAGGQSVLTAVVDATDQTRSVITRIFVDPTRAPQPITEVGTVNTLMLSDSGALAALTLTEGTTQRLLIVRGDELIKVAEASMISAFFVGERLIYYRWDSDTDLSSDTHCATLVGSGVVDRRLEPADRSFSAHFTRKILNGKFFDSFLEPVPGLRFIDLELDGASATRIAEATNPSATLDPPVCNAAGNACAYVEHTDTSAKLFFMHYDTTGPSAPMLVFQSDLQLTLYVTHTP